MPQGRKLKLLEVTDEEREVLQAWARRRKTAQGLASRARIVLMAAEGWSNSAVAEHLRVTRVTVGKWRSRFLEHRLDGLTDEPRPGAPRKVSDAEVEHVITKTLESTPKGADTLEHSLDGGGVGHERHDHTPHLAHLRASASPG